MEKHLTFCGLCDRMRENEQGLDMPKICQVTGKKTQVGMNVSHSKRHTKRAFKTNLQKLKFHSEILNKDYTLSISTNGLRTLVKHGGLDLYILSKSVSRLTPDMAEIRKEIVKKIGQPKFVPAETVRKPNRSARLVKKVAAKQK